MALSSAIEIQRYRCAHLRQDELPLWHVRESFGVFANLEAGLSHDVVTHVRPVIAFDLLVGEGASPLIAVVVGVDSWMTGAMQTSAHVFSAIGQWFFRAFAIVLTVDCGNGGKVFYCDDWVRGSKLISKQSEKGINSAMTGGEIV
jgi:hypothetical protein